MQLHKTAEVTESLMKSRVISKQEAKEIGTELVRRYVGLNSPDVTHIKNSFAFITRGK